MSMSFLVARECATRLKCPDEIPPCPACPDGQKCSVSVQTCESCPATSCIADLKASAAASAAAASKSSGPNVGAIAGGVIGGVAVIAIAVYLIWKFFIKNKREQYEAEYVDQYSDDATEVEKEFAARRDARASTHTVGSIASTVLTRASNIIQIAYIPGVTNRSEPSTPGLLVPPVPPIPIALSNASTPSYEDQHFFMPGDLRDSTYSAMTDRTSYAPRSSVASTIYGKNAVVSPLPAQTVMRGKAAVISVKSNGANSPGDMTPPVPSVDFSKYRANNLQPPPSPAFSVGSTFLNSASAATQMRPTVVRVAANSNKSEKSKSSPDSDDDSSSDSAATRDSSAITIINDTPSMEQGPFSDPPPRAAGHTKKGSLSAVIEEATKKAQSDVRSGLGAKTKDATPFGDENATD